MIKLENLKNKILVPIRKYYVGLILLAIATIYMMILTKESSTEIIDEIHIKLVLTLIYGSISAIVIKEVIDRVNITRYKLLYILVPILMFMNYFIVINNLDTFSSALRYIVLCFITCLMFIVIPFIKRKEDSNYYSYKVLISLILTGFCYFLLVLGINLTIVSISILFEVTLKGYIYFEVPIFLLGIIMPTIFLSLLPEKALEVKEYSLFVKKVLLYLMYPILSIYTIVLYAYFIKILFILKWPTNILGNLVIFYSLISVFVLYFTSNIKTNNKIMDKFIKIYPYVLVLPILMMFISFIIRINYYGVTESRYYGVLCFVFVIISIFIIKFKNRVKYIPITLSILLLISVFGPLSAFNLSRYSQEKRLVQILKSNDMLVDNKIVGNPNISEHDKQRIFNILDYFIINHKLNDISILPNNFEIDDMEEIFGFPNYIL